MLDFITLKGKYIGHTERGIIIGGIPALPNKVICVNVNESTFLHLRDGVKNGWFEMISDNYDKYCKSRNRKVKEETFSSSPSIDGFTVDTDGDKQKVEVRIPVEEKPEETKEEEVKPKKTRKKATKKTEPVIEETNNSKEEE